MSKEVDPFMEGAILYYAETETEDFVKGLEIGQNAFETSLQEHNNLVEDEARLAALREVLSIEGSFLALRLGARAAIDEIVSRQEAAA
jgi:hypothetical protein